MAQNSKEKSANSNEEILRVARERFKLAEEAEAKIREVALEDLNFRAGNQWPSDVKNDRELESRPCLTINRMPQFVRQITNDQRQNRPSVKVFPIDDNGTVDTAKILQGLVRHIEYNSNADIAYDTAFEGAVQKGFGYFRVVTDYVNPTSFEQEILIKRIRNSFTVYLDPNAKEPDGSDAKWGFVFEDMPKDDFKAEYKDATLSDMSDWVSIGNQVPGWVSENNVRVAEYFYTEYKTVELVQLSNGAVGEKSKLPEELPPEIQIVNTRKSQIPVIKWCKINGIDILEQTDWPGRWIPIIPVYGDELDVDGEVIREGVIRHAKDSQRIYNYMTSNEAEAIALAPKAPFIVAEGQITKEYAQQWKTANTKTHAFLTYKPTAHQGQVMGAPQRNAYEPPVQAITNAKLQASEDIKATTGIYDAALGNKSNESSGVAIQRRNNQTQTSNFHFIDNLTRSIRHAGRIIINLIPHIYDTARAVRIIGEEGDQEIVKINQLFEHNGKSQNYDLGAGQYDVAIETGPNFATKRQEAVASMLDLTKAFPQVAQAAGDLMVKNMDWPGAQEISERLKKMLPPGIADDDKKAQPIPPQAQAQLQQQSQLIEQLTEKLKHSTEIINTKSNELESKERIEFAKMQNSLVLESIKLQGAASNALMMKELEQLNGRLNLLDINKPIDGESQSLPPPQQPQNQNLNGSGPEQAVNQNVQQQGALTPQ